ncbi:hypothetical protein [Pedobacter sp. KLB.chiD]|uniref:hypothetical protein n=1 Tax=Pedobacter sp. KLB.chiD TaxID=3387402 RepID=UPI00399BCEF1
MSVYFDYPSIRDFFEIDGNTSCEKINDYEHCRTGYHEQLKSEDKIAIEKEEKTDT